MWPDIYDFVEMTLAIITIIPRNAVFDTAPTAWQSKTRFLEMYEID